MELQFKTLDELKRKIRKLKRLEKIIRFQGEVRAGASLVWDSFFDLREASAKKAKYTIETLSSMSREEYKGIVDEYFARVYYEYYRENGITVTAYDPEVLAQLNLPFDADERDIKKRFRELAKKYHPDTGGDAAKFIELMKVYEKASTRY